MTSYARETISQRTRVRHLLRRFAAGVKEIQTVPRRRTQAKVYLVGTMLIWGLRCQLFGVDTSSPLYPVTNTILFLLVPLCAMIGFVLFLLYIGTPQGSREAGEALLKVGLVNHAGEAPVLVSKTRDKQFPELTIWEFDPCGIPLSEWEDKQSAIETALHIIVAGFTWGARRETARVYAVPAANELSDMLFWKESYLSPKSFVLVLGESYTGPVTVNLAHIPHILLGGSTGSGKSVLLKLLLLQALHKGAEVYIADFKGGVDFPDVWHEKCRMCFTEEDLRDTLDRLVEDLEHRKSAFKALGCPNIDAYNETAEQPIQRIVFACDEVAEVLDKTGADSERKKLLAQIENRLSTIARQGRAFGIHLILATQRPDATVIPGQIKNNMDFRVCGRADNVLSQIILDNTSAAEQIPKNARGRFITGDGTVFQAYLFDEGQL